MQRKKGSRNPAGLSIATFRLALNHKQESEQNDNQNSLLYPTRLLLYPTRPPPHTHMIIAFLPLTPSSSRSKYNPIHPPSVYFYIHSTNSLSFSSPPPPPSHPPSPTHSPLLSHHLSFSSSADPPPPRPYPHPPMVFSSPHSHFTSAPSSFSSFSSSLLSSSLNTHIAHTHPLHPFPSLSYAESTIDSLATSQSTSSFSSYASSSSSPPSSSSLILDHRLPPPPSVARSSHPTYFAYSSASHTRVVTPRSPLLSLVSHTVKPNPTATRLDRMLHLFASTLCSPPLQSLYVPHPHPSTTSAAPSAFSPWRLLPHRPKPHLRASYYPPPAFPYHILVTHAHSPPMFLAASLCPIPSLLSSIALPPSRDHITTVPSFVPNARHIPLRTLLVASAPRPPPPSPYPPHVAAIL